MLISGGSNEVEFRDLGRFELAYCEKTFPIGERPIQVDGPDRRSDIRNPLALYFLNDVAERRAIIGC